MTDVAPARGSLRFRVAIVGLILVCAAVDGVVGLLIGAAIAAWLVFARRPSILLTAAAALFVLVPLSMLARGLPSITRLSPSTSVDDGVTNHLAFAAFASLCAGVLFERSREVRRPARPSLDVSRSASKVLQGSAWMVLAIVVQVVLNASFAIVAARTTDSDSLGRAYALATVVLFIGYATGLGLGVTVARFGIGTSRNSSLVFTWSVILTSASSLVGALICVFAIRPPGGNLLGSDLTSVLILGVVVSGTSIAFLVDVRMQASRLWPFIVVRLAFVGLVRFPLLALRPNIDQGLWIFIVTVGPSAYSGFAGLLLLPRLDGLRFHLRRRPAELSRMVRIAGGDWMTTLSAQAALYILPLFVALRVSPADNASFFLAWSAVTAAHTVPTAVAQVVLVEGARRDDGPVSHRRAWEAIVLAAGICASLWICALVFQDAVIATIGELYTPAARLLPTLLAGCVPSAISAVLVSEARLKGDQRAVVATTMAAAASVLGLAMFWVPHDGIAGAGRAWIVGNLFGGAVAVVTSIRRASRHRGGDLGAR